MCSHFNIEDGRKYTTFLAYYFKEGKNATATHTKKICAECGAACAVTDRKCQKWFAKFLGTTDILDKQFFAVRLSYVLGNV